MSFQKVLDEIPSKIVSGNSVSWSISLNDYPATSWTLSYVLVKGTGQISITAAADGDDHLVEISPTTSADYDTGEYEFHKIITKSDSSERYVLDRGQVEIEPDFVAATSGLDARSFVKRTLDYLEALIEGKVQKDRANYAVAGRSLSSYSWEEIYKLYEDFKAKYSAEKRKKSGRSSTVKAVFK